MANSSGPPFVSLRGVWQMYCLLFAFSIYFFIPFFLLAGAPLAFLLRRALELGPAISGTSLDISCLSCPPPLWHSYFIK